METVICPTCTRVTTAEIVIALSPENPHLAELFRGELNLVECPACQSRFHVEVNQLVYSDPAIPFCLIQHIMPDDDQVDELEQEIDCMMTEQAVELQVPRPKTRLVFNHNDFLEKIFLQDRGLDDRLVEYAKFQLFQNIAGLDRDRHHLLYNFTDSNEEMMHFVVIDQETNQPASALHLPMPEFIKMENEFAESSALQQELELLFPACIVSVDRLSK